MKVKPILQTVLLAGGVVLLSKPAWTDNHNKNQTRVEEGRQRENPNVDRLSRQEVEKLQQALTERGEQPGGVDGVMGPATRQALARFQRKNDLRATGSLNERTAQQLGLEFFEVEGGPKQK